MQSRLLRWRTTQLITSPWQWVVAVFAYYVIHRHGTNNGSIFNMSDGNLDQPLEQGVHSIMLGGHRLKQIMLVWRYWKTKELGMFQKITYWTLILVLEPLLLVRLRSSSIISYTGSTALILCAHFSPLKVVIDLDFNIWNRNRNHLQNHTSFL